MNLGSQSIWQWKAMEYISYAMVVIIPLYVGTSHWFPFSGPKAILIHLLALVLVLLFAWGKLRQRETRFQITWLHAALIGFLGILTLSSLFGYDVHNSFFGTLSQSISLTLLYSCGLIAWGIGFLVRRDRLFIVRLTTWSFGASVIVAIVAYGGELWLPISRMGSTLGNSSYLGAYLLFTICFGGGLFFWYQKRWQRILVTLGLLVIIFCPAFFNSQIWSGAVTLGDALRHPFLFIGQANGALLGVVIALISFGLFMAMRSPKKIIARVGLVAFVLFLIGISITWARFMNPTSSLHIGFAEQKTGNRFLFWDIARQGFVENPILGNGVNNYAYTFQKYYKFQFFKPGFAVEPWTNQPHNMFWQYLSETGVVGLVAFLAIFVGTFWILFTSRDDEYQRLDQITLILAASNIGYFIQNLFIFDVPITYFMWFLLVGFALGRVPVRFEYRFPEKVIRIMYPVIIIGALAGIVITVILPWRESRVWLRMTGANSFINEMIRGPKIQNISSLGGTADSAFLVDKFFAQHQSDVVTLLKNTQSFAFMNGVEKFLADEVIKQPRVLRARTTLARVLVLHMIVQGKPTEELWRQSYDQTLRALQLNSQDPEPYFILAQLSLLVGDYTQARIWARAGIALAPEYPIGYQVASDINKIQPNAVFWRYVTTMQERWNLKK